ncbi:MAG: response regulator [Candidatus Accumulibacter sp.]|nr:response regulator [Accumulibacter sp.]
MFFFIVAIMAAILALGIALSLSISRERMETQLLGDMEVVSKLAEKMVSNRLALLKSEARSVVAAGAGRPESELHALLESALLRYDYLSAAIFEGDRLLAAAGHPTPPERSSDRYAHMALSGETSAASPELADDGDLALRVYAAFANRLLVVTTPGLMMSDMLSEFNILETGSIFMVDRRGVAIAYRQPELVMQQRSFIEMGRASLENEGLSDTISRMAAGENGTGYYTFEGEARLCVFRPVRNSDGWSLGVVVPLDETVIKQTRDMLVVSGLILFALGCAAALFASIALAKPFETIARQNDELTRLKQVAESASEAKTRFIANTSHEMRTPLNAIIGLSELALEAPELPEDVEADLEKIYSSGVGLLSIINDLLDVSKIEAGRFALIPVEYDVPSMVNDTRSLNLLRIVDKPIGFSLAIDETMPSRLLGDEIRVKQIFNNLLSNAFKYTQQGEVEWRLSYERDGDSVWVTSSVRDSGIGIREEDIGKLFTNYGQVDTKSNRKIEGTGLGLAITRRLAEMMDGEITVESEYGKGSTFTVRIRQGFVSDAPIGAEVAKNLRGYGYVEGKRRRNAKLVRIQLPDARVLVVDDVPTNLDVVKGIMKPYGMKVDCVSSGAEAVAAVRAAKVHYDAIFMDHMMPGMDGVEATRIIREEIGTDYARRVPIIALTANAMAGNEAMFLENGFQAFLSKPIDIVQMDAAIRQWVRDANEAAPAEAAAPQAPAAAAGPMRPIDGLDWAQGCARFGGDTEIYLDVLRSYATTTADLAESIRSPEKDRLADYAIVVHGIKGSSYGIGAMRVGHRAEELEHAAKNGDFDAVAEKNPEFLRALNALLAGLNDFLEGESKNDAEKENRDAPDPALLARLRDAAGDFRIDDMEAAMRELEKFSYASGGDLVRWLRQKVDRMEFADIAGRLAEASADPAAAPP